MKNRDNKQNQNQDSDKYHVAVLLQSTIESLNIKPGNWYIDCTLGGGGHAGEILKCGGKVIGVDQDQDALDHVGKKLSKYIENGSLILEKSNFNGILEIAQKHKLPIQGILFDLGISSHQIDGNDRGFSFQTNEPLDMRMDPENQTTTAENLVNDLSERELYKILYKYGEDPLSKKVSKAIVDYRRDKPITKTKQLAELINNLYQHTYSSFSRTHPATKTFQALRIAVNNELENFKNALKQAIKIIEPNGRIAVITFHSLEDRIAKREFISWQEDGQGKTLSKKPIVAEKPELQVNARSRSAKLRVFEKHEN